MHCCGFLKMLLCFSLMCHWFVFLLYIHLFYYGPFTTWKRSMEDIAQSQRNHTAIIVFRQITITVLSHRQVQA